MKKLILSCLLSLYATQLYATTLPFKDLGALVKEADGIVVGTVRKVESQHSPDGAIYTFVTLDQLQLVKGQYQQATFTLRLKGGQVDKEILDVHGSPQFETHDKVILFVRHNGRSIVPVVGWTQGVFRVQTDVSGKYEEVVDHEGNRVLGLQHGNVLLKEQLYAPRAHIVGGADGVAAFGAAPATAGPSDQDQGSSRVQPETPKGTMVKTAISVEDFLAVLQQQHEAHKAAVSAAYNEPELVSVDVGDFGRTAGQQTITPKSLRAPQTGAPQSVPQQPFLPRPLRAPR